MKGLFALLALLATCSAVPQPLNYQASTADQPIFLITSNPPHNIHPCLQAQYHGAYGSRQDEHIYLTTDECLHQQHAMATLYAGGGSLTGLPARTRDGHGRLVWVGQAGVQGMEGDDVGEAFDGILALAVEAQAMLQGSSVAGVDRAQSGQAVFGMDGGMGDRASDIANANANANADGLTMIYRSKDSLVLYVSDALLPLIDTLLPSHLVPVAIPLTPYPTSDAQDISTTDWKPVPERYAKHLANLTKHLHFDPALDSVLAQIDLGVVRRNVRWLTGEGPSGITSRHSFTPGAITAGNWIAARMEETGATCDKVPFLTGFAPNIICYYPTTSNSSANANEEENVILSAHYDSRGSWGSTTAPGGDDDGSGSGHLLAIGQAIGEAGVKFEKRVVLAFFAGEEQGLLGSHAFAEQLYNDKAKVLLHIQADMLAYRVPGEPLQLALPESIHLPEASHFLGNLSQLYSPELLVGKTPACCSDHQSFLSFGFPASAVFERNGPIADPKYHNTGDVSSREGYDFEQVVSIAKVTMASVLTVAGWSI